MMNSSVSTLYNNKTRSATSLVLSTTMAANEESVKCDLTDRFGFFIQGLLAVVAFSTLICKLKAYHKSLLNFIEIFINFNVF